MSHRPHNAPRVALRTALVLSTVGAALAAGAGAAAAAPGELPGTTDAIRGTVTGLSSGIGPVKRLQLDPMARTAVDPLTNGVGTKVADFKPIGTDLITKPLTQGDSLSQLPLVGQVAKLLPGG
jgi:hypothetical protein